MLTNCKIIVRNYTQDIRINTYHCDAKPLYIYYFILSIKKLVDNTVLIYLVFFYYLLCETVLF